MKVSDVSKYTSINHPEASEVENRNIRVTGFSFVRDLDGRFEPDSVIVDYEELLPNGKIFESGCSLKTFLERFGADARRTKRLWDAKGKE